MNEPAKLPWRARLMWWLMCRAQDASAMLRWATIAIWRRALERQRRSRSRKRTRVKKWEAWYLGDDGTCGNCGVANDNAGQLVSCPTCGYEGKEISIG